MEPKLVELLAKFKADIDLTVATGDKYQFQESAYDLIEQLASLEEPFVAVRPIFEVIENAPAIDFGEPGAIGAFLESFYQQGYEEELMASLERQPTTYTIFLLFRIIDNAKEPRLGEYRTLLQTLVDEPWLDPFWKDEISKL